MSRLPGLCFAASVSTALSLLLCGTATTKDPPWIAKDWTQWTNEDCQNVLGQSPWLVQPTPADISEYQTSTYVLLCSALPIRQAVLRQLQLENRYEKMTPDKRQVFDSAHAHDLDSGGQIVVSITNDSPGGYADYARQAALRLPDGVLVPATVTKILDMNEGYSNACQYEFPRAVGGKPLYSPNDSMLEVVVGAPLSFDKKTKQVIPEPFRYAWGAAFFKIPALMYKGKLEY
jgi:hypothetical protein